MPTRAAGGASASGGGSPDGRRPSAGGAPAGRRPSDGGSSLSDGPSDARVAAALAAAAQMLGSDVPSVAVALASSAEERRQLRRGGSGSIDGVDAAGSRRSSSLHSSSDILEAQARQRGRASPTDVDNGDAAAAAAPALAGWPASGPS